MNKDININTNQKDYPYKLTPFKLAVLQNFPYIEADFDALTDYGLLCKVVEYLNNVIANQNVVQDNVTALNNAFTELKNYIDTYFGDELTERVDAKLNEFAENGTLEQIIAKYINNKFARTYNTLADMKSDTSLIDGMYANTLGYYTINDHGNSLYYISSKKPTTGYFENLDNGNYAQLIIDDNTSVKNFGAYGNGNIDDYNSFNKMLNACNYIHVTDGTYLLGTGIMLKSNQFIYGDNKDTCILKATSNINLIFNEDISTSKNISIHDLTLKGSNKTGVGIYLIRTTKEGDTYHRLYNLRVNSFNYGIQLEKNLNEIQISDVVCSSNNYGMYIHLVNDFYAERVVCCVNNKHGLFISNSTEGRISDTKAWYNGSDNADSYYNIYLTSSTAIMMTNIGCQESYGTNLLLQYSKNISLDNCYLSLPCLDGNEHFQLSIDNLQDSYVKIQCADKKINDNYINKILRCSNTNIRNTIEILTENDFPENNILTQIDSNNGYGFCTRNSIKVNNSKYFNFLDLNYVINGNLSNNNDISKFVSQGSSYCSIVNNMLEINNTTNSTLNIGFKHPALPEKGLYSYYVLFKKVSGTGRVIVAYNGYIDITNVSTDNILCASFVVTKSSTSAVSNLSLSLPANTVIDILEIGMTRGITSNIGCPLYKNSILS